MKFDLLDHGFVVLVDSMPARTVPVLEGYAQETGWGCGDQRVVDAARVSIAGQGVRPVNDDQKLVRYLLKNKHTTPFEKVRFEVHVKAPIFVARQWFRHRTGSFNEMSARYGVLPREFYVPALDRMQEQSASNKQASGEVLPETRAIRLQQTIRTSSENAYADYEALLKGGLARELARMVLTFNTYTQWFWTVDLHNLMHFLRLRLAADAQYEIRVYAEALRKMARSIAPCTMTAFDESLAVTNVE